MKKFIITLSFLGLICFGIQAQLKLNLSLLPDNETYMVSMITDQIIEAPFNTISNIQIILHTPAGEPFEAGSIQSLVSGITWEDGSYSDELVQENLPNLFVFNMKERSTTVLTFEEGLETPLFTFKNKEGGCVGEISLLDNDHEIIQDAISKGYNYTQNFTVLAARGNGFTGIINDKVDCNLSNTTQITQIENVKIYPIPTIDELTVEWINTEIQDDLQLNIISLEGKKIKSLRGFGQRGEHTVSIDLGSIPAGVYTLRFQADQKVQDFKFMVSRR